MATPSCPRRWLEITRETKDAWSRRDQEACMSDSMSRDRNRERRSSPGEKRQPADMSARRGENEREPRGEPRQRSFIEPREWRGAGVCGDRHTD
jgi:hypothetical protein